MVDISLYKKMSKKFIDYKSDTINKYFHDVKNLTLLTPDEELDMVIRVENGDEVAREKLINSNLKFVVSVAKEYQGQGLTLSDLISEGNLGLIKASTRFDHTRGFRFISYAVWWIRQSIMQSLNDNCRTIRYPANVINKMIATRKKMEELSLNNDIDNFDNVDLFNEDGYIDINLLPKTTSLNNPIGEDGSEFYELIEDKDVNFDLFDENNLILKNEINIILSKISERERDIIKYYFGIDQNNEGMTLEAIGEKYNLTKERIRQIKNKSLRKLRHYSNNLFEIIND